ncbi:MAG: winged helix-turn-helix transcriptional regulator [Candidatus Zixiibacteriota bacterium]|nr:MAG: winged helix-turn-helix transcriptional regulator [candidate division Zixibacteria bacterium]
MAFKALSEPVRLRTVVLLTEGELCVCDLTEVLSLPQSTVSRHMSRLKTAGLVSDRREGKWVYYRLADPSSRFLVSLSGYFKSLCYQQPFKEDLIRLRKHLAGKSDDQCRDDEAGPPPSSRKRRKK